MIYIAIIFSFISGAVILYFFQKSKTDKLVNKIEAALNSIYNKQNLTVQGLPVKIIKAIDRIKSNTGISNESERNTNQPVYSSPTAAELQKLIDHLYIVNELGQKVTSSLNLSQTFDHLYATINSMMDAAVLELRVFNPDTDTWNVFSNVGDQKSGSTNSGNYNHMAEWSFKNNREVFLEDAEKDFGRYVFKPLIFPDGKVAKSIMVFPIIENNAVSGTLSIISFQRNKFSDYHQEIIRLLLGYISVAIDNAITHDELNRTKLRAEQSEKFKEQFLANMSHEIRTPIHAVTGMTRLMLDKNPRPDQLRYLDSIKNASDSLLVIINDILDLSKIEAGKIEFEEIDFSLTEILNNVQEIMHFKAEEKGLNLNIEYINKAPNTLKGDPTRLSQVLINLISNAIKFTNNGSVDLRVQLLSKENNSGIFEFTVEDTGIGMNEEQLSRLFKEYSQASSDTSRKYGGTGLGLNISQQLIQLQGGDIRVESHYGIGSKFIFYIPYIISSESTLSFQEPVISAEMIIALKGIRVLIVDDNEYNRIVAKETLEMKLGHVEVHEAFDGEMAIELISKNDFDVVLMDLVMPNMDGFAASKYIREQMPSPKNSVKLIALTASVIKSEIKKSFDYGMNGFIPKPFSAYDLIGTIYKVLNEAGNLIFSEQGLAQDLKTINESNIDLDYLIELTEGDTYRMQKFIDTFLSEIPGATQKLKESLTNNDFESIRIISHSIKPRLTSLGLGKGLDLAQEIELNSASTKNKEKLETSIQQLISICNNAVIELSNYPSR